MIYNGKDSQLIFEVKSSRKLFERIFNDKEWIEQENIEFKNINFFNAFELAKKLAE